MRTLILCLILLSANLASANLVNFAVEGVSQGPTDPQVNESHYSQLIDIFSKGTLPTQSELKGFWSGRCFTKSTPNNPFGIALVSEFYTKNPEPTDNGGPLFPPAPPVTSFISALVNGLGDREKPDRYDVLSKQDKFELEKYMTTENFTSLSTVDQDGALVTVNESGNLKYLVRKNENYFSALTIMLRNSGEYKAGDIFTSCYFFKKVHE